MSGVETKSPGYYTRGVREKVSDKKGFDTAHCPAEFPCPVCVDHLPCLPGSSCQDRLVFRDDELSYALGKEA